MAIIHQATLSPSKLELLAAQVSAWPELNELVDGELTHLGAYRFDDPAGQVGLETHILTSGTGVVLQLPLTYRNNEIPGAQGPLVGTMEHSVLGTRWAYDGCFDDVYGLQLLLTILTGGTGVAEIVETPDGPAPRDPSARVQGSGALDVDAATGVMPPMTTTRSGLSTQLGFAAHRVTLHHVIVGGDTTAPDPDGLRLTGAWAGQPDPVVLATVTNS